MGSSVPDVGTGFGMVRLLVAQSDFTRAEVERNTPSQCPSLPSQKNNTLNNTWIKRAEKKQQMQRTWTKMLWTKKIEKVWLPWPVWQSVWHKADNAMFFVSSGAAAVFSTCQRKNYHTIIIYYTQAIRTNRPTAYSKARQRPKRKKTQSPCPSKASIAHSQMSANEEIPHRMVRVWLDLLVRVLLIPWTITVCIYFLFNLGKMYSSQWQNKK